MVAIVAEQLLVGAVAYTPNVVPIWEGIRDYFRGSNSEMDFVLYSNGIEVTQFDVPDVRFSDHRPLICDFQVRRAPT